MSKKLQPSVDNAVAALIAALHSKQVHLLSSSACSTSTGRSDSDLFAVEEGGFEDNLSAISKQLSSIVYRYKTSHYYGYYAVFLNPKANC
jgi:hypothetical protein